MASSITPAQAELINSLPPDDIPIKLRCAICSKLAVNAFRLPCCEQAICETCQSTLPTSCPVCEHSPLSADDCKPHKSLRTTIKVFLRTQEKKREEARLKETRASAPSTPVDAKPSVQTAAGIQSPVVEAPSQPFTAPISQNESQDPSFDSARDTADQVKEEDATEITGQDGLSQDQEPTTAETHPDDTRVVGVRDGEDAVAEPDSESREGDADAEYGSQNQNEQNGSFGFNAMNGGSYPNINFAGNGDMNQMQMMMAMQNGMAPNAFGTFPMMGMPGMGMDPMAMQNMYMNGGFGSQGMGMGGFDGSYGSGSNNNWNGQQSWNFGQDNFNHANATGMGSGDYGTYNNTGFQSGYNQGNYGHQFNDYRRNNYGNRGRGRGRGYGGYSRGGGGYQAYGQNPDFSDQNQMQPQYGQGMSGQGQIDVPTGPGESNESRNVDEFGREIRPDADDDSGNQPRDVSKDEQDTNRESSGPTGPQDKGHNELAAHNDASGQETPGDASKLAPASGDPRSTLNGNAMSTDYGMPPPRGGKFGHHNMGFVPTVPDVPLNAPKGPKAMLQGLPNTSLPNLRARGLLPNDRAPQLQGNGTGLPSPDAERPKSRSSSPEHTKDSERSRHEDLGKDREKDNEKSRDRDYDGRERDYSRSRSPSRSPDRRSERHRRRRHRSESISGDEHDDDYRRRKHRSRKHSARGDDDESKTRSRDEEHEERSRSTSPDDPKRPSHRSRRDRDDKRRDRDKEKHRDEDDYDSRRKSTHRSHRDRQYDRDHKDRDKEKDRKRDKHRDREHRHRSSRKHSTEPPTPVEKDFNPPTGPRAALEIKGVGRKPSMPSSDRRDSTRRDSQASISTSNKPTSGVPTKDPHALEREARDRERLLKETQRMAGLTGLAGTKRSRDDVDDGRRGRRKGRRSEAVSVGDEEERMQRLEAEREGGRWG